MGKDANPWLLFHLFTIAPCLPLGGYLLLRPSKGDDLHKILGKAWSYLMVVTSLSSFFLRHKEGKFSWLHGLSCFTIFSVYRGIKKIQVGDMKGHQRTMFWTYFGSLIAFGFALRPERFVGNLLRQILSSLKFLLSSG